MAILGTNLILSYREAGGSYSNFAASTNCSFDVTVNQVDVTSYSSDWFKQYKNDIAEWSVTCDGLISIGDYDYKDMLDAHLNRTRITIRFTIGTPSQNVVYGFGYITSLTLNGPVEDVASYSVTITGAGPYSYSNPNNCGRYLVTFSTAGSIEYVDCNDGQLYGYATTGPGSFYQCAAIAGGLAQIFITSGTGTISPTGLCSNQ
jgi:predicted secreted protein